MPGHAWLLIGGSFINRFGSFVVPFLVLYLRNRGFSIAHAGAAVAAYGGGELVASPLGGHLADRVGRRATIALSMYASAAAMLALSQARTYWAIVALALVAGLVSEARRPASLALLTDLTPDHQRVTTFAVLRFAESAAFAGGLALGGFLATHSFLWLFLGDAASSAAYGTIAVALLPEGRRSQDGGEAGGRAATGFRSILADRAFVRFLVATLVVFFVYFQLQATLPLHVRRSGMSAADFGLLLALNGVLVMAFELPLSSLTMRWPKRPVIATGFGLVGLGFGLTAVAHGFLPLAGTVAVWSLGEMVAAPVSYAYVAEVAPEDMRGRYQGMFGLCFGLGGVAGPALGTILFARSEDMFWLLTGVLGAVSAALVLSGRPSPRAGGPLGSAESGEPAPEAADAPRA